jgi:hypothetical protein
MLDVQELLHAVQYACICLDTVVSVAVCTELSVSDWHRLLRFSVTYYTMSKLQSTFACTLILR